MTPKVAKRGGSFKGAASYYLHDKDASTSKRVTFCLTRNLPVDEPELAWRWMAYTARHAGILKHDAEVAPTGTKMSKPVYTLSLSWDPKEPKPEPAEMVSRMESALKKIGLAKCQALLVAHNDTAHPHIHAIVNLVDPDTGKIIRTGKDHEKLSRWAQAYEQEQGAIRCPRRVENNARRDRGERVVDRHSKTRQDIEQARLIEREILAERRRALWGRQVADREGLKRQAEERAQAIRAEIKERYRPAWAAFYKKQRQDARDTKSARRSVLAAMRVAIKERRRLKPEGRAGIATILAYTISARALGDALAEAGERERAELRAAMSADRQRMVKAVWQEYGRDYGALKEAQAEARKTPPPLAPDEEARRRLELKLEQQKAQTHAERQGALDVARQREAQQREADQRRTELKAEFRQQAEEMARQREARRQKNRERDRQDATLPAPESAGTPRRKIRRDYAELQEATARAATTRQEQPGTMAPKTATPEDDAAREELKAEFRRQADELARRRKERTHKDRDRDRER